MENQKKPLLIRPYMAQKQIQKRIVNPSLCLLWAPTHGFVCELLCAFAKLVQKFSNFTLKPGKSHTKQSKR